jgi:hypothetical protein
MAGIRDELLNQACVIDMNALKDLSRALGSPTDELEGKLG